VERCADYNGKHGNSPLTAAILKASAAALAAAGAARKTANPPPSRTTAPPTSSLRPPSHRRHAAAVRAHQRGLHRHRQHGLGTPGQLREQSRGATAGHVRCARRGQKSDEESRSKRPTPMSLTKAPIPAAQPISIFAILLQREDIGRGADRRARALALPSSPSKPPGPARIFIVRSPSRTRFARHEQW